MTPTIDEVKNQVRRTFLGQGGIHGVGVNRAAPAIRVYLSPDDAGSQQEVLARLRESAKPFMVEVVAEERARIA